MGLCSYFARDCALPHGISRGAKWGRSALSTQAEALNQRAVTLDVDALEVPEKTTTLPDEKQKAATRVVVVLVSLEVLSEFVDSVRHQSNLDLGRTRVTGVGLVLLDDGLFFFGGHSHNPPCSFFVSLRGASTLVEKLSLSAAGTRHKG